MEHYLIIGAYSGAVTGCCIDKEDVLAEEPHATFAKIDSAKCPICNKNKDYKAAWGRLRELLEQEIHERARPDEVPVIGWVLNTMLQIEDKEE